MTTLTINALSLTEQEGSDLYAALAQQEAQLVERANERAKQGQLDSASYLRHQSYRVEQLRIRVGALIAEAVQAQESGEPLDEQRRRLVG